MTGWFVAVEGIDASGKSTVAAQLAAELTAAGRPAVLVDRRSAPALAGGYPGEHLAGLARLIWDYPPDARTSELGFCHWSRLLAAWFHAVSEVVVGPALAGGATVIADSWWHKFAARFALTVGLSQARAVFDGATVPDQVLWLDVPPQVCAQRRTALRATERGEWQGLRDCDDGYLRYQRQVRAVLESMATAGGWRVLPDAADERLAAALELVTGRAAAAGAIAGTPA
ncbi:MAG TPA: AAA family ATPase [Streptosporangiaceae bacterium]